MNNRPRTQRNKREGRAKRPTLHNPRPEPTKAQARRAERELIRLVMLGAL
mgnify:CR=1 FL=1